MSLVDGNGLSAADVAAVMGNGNGNGFGWGGDAAWWIIILVLFAMAGNGFGNGFGGGNSGVLPYMLNGSDQSAMQRGFDQQSVMNGLNGITASLANAEVSRCNTQANLLATMNANQNANSAAMNQLAMSLQNCCCENRAGIANLQYTVASEACANRTAANQGFRDVIDATNAGNQRILDKLCQLELDGVKQRYEAQVASLQDQVNGLRTDLSASRSAASQTAQTAQILADNAAQTLALEQYLNPTPKPAYVVQNPNCCSSLYNSCGCMATA